MKKSFFLTIAALLAFVVGCDNAANMEAMKAQTMRTIDSLAAAEVSTQRANLLNQCTQSIDAAVQLRVDSLMAIATPSKNITSPGKTKPAAKPAPKPVVTPTNPPTQPTKKPVDPIDQQKARGGTTNSAEAIDKQKARGGEIKSTEKGATTSTASQKEMIEKQKTRGGTPK